MLIYEKIDISDGTDVEPYLLPQCPWPPNFTEL